MEIDQQQKYQQLTRKLEKTRGPVLGLCNLLVQYGSGGITTAELFNHYSPTSELVLSENNPFGEIVAVIKLPANEVQGPITVRSCFHTAAGLLKDSYAVTGQIKETDGYFRLRGVEKKSDILIDSQRNRQKVEYLEYTDMITLPELQTRENNALKKMLEPLLADLPLNTFEQVDGKILLTVSFFNEQDSSYKVAVDPFQLLSRRKVFVRSNGNGMEIDIPARDNLISALAKELSLRAETDPDSAAILAMSLAEELFPPRFYWPSMEAAVDGTHLLLTNYTRLSLGSDSTATEVFGNVDLEDLESSDDDSKALKDLTVRLINLRKLGAVADSPYKVLLIIEQPRYRQLNNKNDYHYLPTTRAALPITDSEATILRSLRNLVHRDIAREMRSHELRLYAAERKLKRVKKEEEIEEPETILKLLKKADTLGSINDAASLSKIIARHTIALNTIYSQESNQERAEIFKTLLRRLSQTAAVLGVELEEGFNPETYAKPLKLRLPFFS